MSKAFYETLVFIKSSWTPLSTSLRQEVTELSQKLQIKVRLSEQQQLPAGRLTSGSLMLSHPQAPLTFRLVLISQACAIRLHYQMPVTNIKRGDKSL